MSNQVCMTDQSQVAEAYIYTHVRCLLERDHPQLISNLEMCLTIEVALACHHVQSQIHPCETSIEAAFDAPITLARAAQCEDHRTERIRVHTLCWGCLRQALDLFSMSACAPCRRELDRIWREEVRIIHWRGDIIERAIRILRRH